MTSRRMIDPAIWESEQVASLAIRQRLLWVGLITNADDQGRGKAHPGLVRARVFPLDDFSNAEMQEDIAAISQAGLVILYESPDGTPLYQISKWWEYQTPSWAWPSKLEPPPNWIDREKYRKGNDVKKRNWERIGREGTPGGGDDGPTVTPERDQGESTLTPAPNDNGSGSGSGSEEHTAGAASTPPEKPKRKPTERDKRVTTLTESFCEITGLPPPSTKTDKQRRAAAQAWWNPLQAIAKTCDDDAERTKALMAHTVSLMDEAGLTISDPRSIKKTALSEQAKRLRGVESGGKARRKKSNLDRSLENVGLTGGNAFDGGI